MRILSREKVNAMSIHERKRAIENIKSSNLSYEEKRANLELLEENNDRVKKVLQQTEESQADISDMGE